MVLTCVCGQLFRDKTDLNRHQNRKISCLIVKITNFKCESCNTYFSSVSNLNKHMKKHKNVCLSTAPVHISEIEEIAEKDKPAQIPAHDTAQNPAHDTVQNRIQNRAHDTVQKLKESQIEEILEPIQEFYLEDIVVGMNNKDYKWYCNLKIDNL